MNCKNKFCVYELDSKCTLGEININNIGMCSCYVQTDIKTYVLLQAKDTHLRREEDRKRYLGEL